MYADRGYPSAEREATLREAGWRVQIQRKGSATKPISQTQKQRNRRIATLRVRVEHVFGAMRPHGRKTGALHGDCAHHLRVEHQNCQLQLAATRVFERTRPTGVLKREPA